MESFGNYSTRPAVLVVDDEPDVRSIVSVLVGELGYPVLQAGGADEAIDILRGAAPVGLLLTDLAMPEMSGADLANIAKLIRPDMKVLYTSAYVRGDSADNPALRHGPILEKPWVLKDLRVAVADLMGSGDGAAPQASRF